MRYFPTVLVQLWLLKKPPPAGYVRPMVEVRLKRLRDAFVVSISQIDGLNR